MCKVFAVDKQRSTLYNDENLEGIYGNDRISFHVQNEHCSAARRSRSDFVGLVLSYPNFRIIYPWIRIYLIMTVQVEGVFDLHRFYILRKEACIMPEQPVRHQEDTESNQQTILLNIKGDMNYENNRYCSSGRIQCRNRT